MLLLLVTYWRLQWPLYSRHVGHSIAFLRLVTVTLTFWPRNLATCRISRYHFFHIVSLNTLESVVFELSCGQTDRQTDRITDKTPLNALLRRLSSAWVITDVMSWSCSRLDTADWLMQSQTSWILMNRCDWLSDSRRDGGCNSFSDTRNI